MLVQSEEAPIASSAMYAVDNFRDFAHKYNLSVVVHSSCFAVHKKNAIIDYV